MTARSLSTRALWLFVCGFLPLVSLFYALGPRPATRARSTSTSTTATPPKPYVVWLHYFALLLVIVAVVQPRQGPIWFVGLPLQLVVTTGVYKGSTLQTVAMLAAAAVTVALALSPSSAERGRRTVSSRIAARP